MIRWALGIILLISITANAQIQVNIDNGYLSGQGWGIAIHPSGKYVVKADRSIIRAYDRSNHMLFQTFQSPCIANKLSFDGTGQYLVVETIGEIADACQRTLVFDFFTGRLLFDNTGAVIPDLAEGSRLYHAYTPTSIYEHAFSDSMPLLRSFNLEFKQFDTVSFLRESVKKEPFAKKNRHVRSGEVADAGLVWDTLDYAFDWTGLEQQIKHGNVKLEYQVDSFYTNLPGLGGYGFVIGIYDSVLIVFNDSRLELSNIFTHKHIKTIPDISVFNYHWMGKEQKLVFRPESGDSVCILEMKTWKDQRVMVPGLRYYWYILFESDSVVHLLKMDPIRKVKLNPKTGFFYDWFNFITEKGELPTSDFNQEFEGRADGRNQCVIHEKSVIVDVKNRNAALFDVRLETMLIHPAVVYTFPYDSSRLVINDMQWNLRSAVLFTPFVHYISRNAIADTLIDAFDSLLYTLEPVSKIKPAILMAANNLATVFNMGNISFPKFTQYGDREENSMKLLDEDYETIAKRMQDVKAYNQDDGILFVYDWGKYFKFGKADLKSVAKQEKVAVKFIEDNYNEAEIYRLNNNFPDFIFPYNQSDNNEFLPAFTGLKTRDKTYELYYPVIESKKYKYIKLPPWHYEEYDRYFLGKLVKASYVPALDSANRYIMINILNPLDHAIDEIPDITYAGINSANDIYFNDITFPVCHNRFMSLNYAYGIVKLLDSSRKVIVQSSVYRDGGFIHTTPDGYYFGSKSQVKRISIRKGTEVFPIEQFDLQYNRPDIVMQRLGLRDTLKIKLYRQAYEKRLRKAGFTEEMFSTDWMVPQLEIVNKDSLMAQNGSNNMRIHILASDTNTTLDRLNVWINEVPVFGANGISLRNRNIHTIDTAVWVTLSDGLNRLEASVLNIKGAESYKRPLNLVSSSTEDVSAKVHFIGIGIDRFADDRHNLQYCVKDISDLAARFRERYGDTLVMDTLFNKDVTLANVVRLKQKLLKSGVNDKVIVAYSGHGLLSKDLDYYLSAYSVNFEDPEQNGLPYGELENLLDSIPARKKLMLIDACHSGEVDKDEIFAMNKTAGSLGLSKGSIMIGDPPDVKVGLENSFELMQSLFVNMGKSTGATIISAAAGNQFALERGDLKNGVFTFSILEAMNIHPGLKVSRLKKIVGERVEQLTNGLQKPTSRNEMIAVDWDVW